MTTIAPTAKKRGITIKRSAFAIPYIAVLIIFVVVPLLFILFYAFTDDNFGFTLSNFSYVFSATSLKYFWRSMLIGLATTAICLLIGYPIAYFCARKEFGVPGMVVFLFILPMWINFVLRTYATRALLEVIDTELIHTNFSIIVGMVYNYLPFMIMPLYTVLRDMDKSYTEAACDLGASPLKSFATVTVPLSVPGIVSGITMVFMPSVASVAISDMMTENTIDVFGNFVDSSFKYWHQGSALSVFLLVLVGITMIISTKFGDKDSGNRGGLI